MILVLLRHWRRYGAIDELRPAFEFLEKYADGAGLEEGRQELDGSLGHAVASTSWPKPASDCPFEAHPKHIEVLYLIAGSELVGHAPEEKLGPQLSYDEIGDIAVYGDPQEFVHVQLRARELVCVFYPEDGHMTACRLDRDAPVHRIEIKLPAGPLE